MERDISTRARGFVLAGGRSSRFGSDKAVHLVDGVPMAVRVFRAMEQAGYEPCFVARDRRLAEFGPVLVEDLSGEVHPLNGVVAALQQGGGVMAPCDLPFLPAEAFSGLNWGELEAGCPLLGKLGPAWLPRATMFLAQQRSVRAFAQAAHRVTMPSDWLRNVNRPSDLDRPSS